MAPVKEENISSVLFNRGTGILTMEYSTANKSEYSNIHILQQEVTAACVRSNVIHKQQVKETCPHTHGDSCCCIVIRHQHHHRIEHQFTTQLNNFVPPTFFAVTVKNKTQPLVGTMKPHVFTSQISGDGVFLFPQCCLT